MSGVDVLGSFHMKQSQSTDPYHLMSSMCSTYVHFWLEGALLAKAPMPEPCKA